MPAKKTEPDVPADVLAAYEKMVAGNPAVERKGAGIPYTSHNGNMFTYINRDGAIVLRMSNEDREAFVAKYKTPPVVSYGAVMKEYVNIPPELLKKPKELKKHFDQSYAYVQTLKPKPTTKAKKK